MNMPIYSRKDLYDIEAEALEEIKKTFSIYDEDWELSLLDGSEWYGEIYTVKYKERTMGLMSVGEFCSAEHPYGGYMEYRCEENIIYYDLLRTHTDFIVSNIKLMSEKAYYKSDRYYTKTIGKLMSYYDGLKVVIAVGNSAADILRRMHDNPESIRHIHEIDVKTLVTDYDVISDADLKAGTISNTDEKNTAIIIAIDDSTVIKNPNVERYKNMDMTDLQAKTMHLRNLGYTQEEIAVREGTTRNAIKEREALATEKLGSVTIYKKSKLQ